MPETGDKSGGSWIPGTGGNFPETGDTITTTVVKTVAKVVLVVWIVAKITGK